MTTGGTLFSGGELCGVGMRQAGIDHRWGIEISADIAGVAKANGFNVMVADVLTVDPAQMEPVDCLHVSPECQRASNANHSAELNEEGTKETPLDKAFGVKIAQFIDVIRPKIFTLENVFAYRNFQAFKAVCAALNRNGYMWDFDNLNAADYGVPQSRRRLILRAVRGRLLPNLPQAERWVGWYEAIEDLIPGLPESKFANWQLERLPKELLGSVITRPKKFNPATERGAGYYMANQPAPTVMTDNAAQRAFVIGSHYGEPSNGTDEPRKPQLQIGNEPYFTVTASGGKHNDARACLNDTDIPDEVKALLIADEYGSPKNGQERILFTRDVDEPAMTVKAQAKSTVRAWLSDTGVPDDVKAEVDAQLDAAFSQNGIDRARSWLVDGQNSRAREKGGLSVITEDEPAMTIGSAMHGKPKAWLQHGRVVSMTPRALARFQSVPDSYILPVSNKLACTIIGNGVSCLLAEKIYKHLLEATNA